MADYNLRFELQQNRYQSIDRKRGNGTAHPLL